MPLDTVSLVEDKLLSLIERCEDMSFEILQSVIKKGKASVGRRILQLISLSISGSSLFVLEKGVKASSADQVLKPVKNENFNDPKKFIFMLRSIFEHHKTDVDLMKGIVQLLKIVVHGLGEAYATNEDHIRTRFSSCE